MPNPTYGLRAKFVNGKLYAISGFMFGGNPDTRIYDPVTDHWSFGAPLPADILRHFFGCAVVGTKIYVIGGDCGCGPPGGRDQTYAYDTATNTWNTTPLAVLPGGARSFLAAVNLNGKIYAIGGVDTSGQYSDRVDIYDSSTDTWSSGTALPAARSNMAAEAINGKIYLAGGAGVGGIPLRNALVFDGGNPGSWTSIADLPIVGNVSGQSTILGGKFFIIGAGPGASENNTVQAYDPVSNTWSTNYSLLPTARANGAAAGDDGSAKIYFTGGDISQFGFIGELDILSVQAAPAKLYVAGGEVAACPGSPVATLEGYTPDTDTWVNLGPMPTARKNLGAATVNDMVNDVVYFIGGQTGCSGAVGNVEAYNVGTKIWTEENPMHFPRSEVGIGVIDNKIYAVGGDDGSGVPQSTLEVYDPNADPPGGAGLLSPQCRLRVSLR